MNINQTPSNDQLLISVTREWLERLNRAEITLEDGSKVKVGWIEPLVDQGSYRLEFVYPGYGWALVNAIDSGYFSRS